MQEMNRLDAMMRLLELVNSVAHPPRSRKPTKPTFGSKQKRLESKGQRSKTKSLRSKITRATGD